MAIAKLVDQVRRAIRSVVRKLFLSELRFERRVAAWEAWWKSGQPLERNPRVAGTTKATRQGEP